MSSPPAAETASTGSSIDPSLQKVHKSIETLKSKLEKANDQIADLKKTNAELKSAGSRIKKIPKSKVVAEAEVPADGSAPAAEVKPKGKGKAKKTEGGVNSKVPPNEIAQIGA